MPCPILKMGGGPTFDAIMVVGDGEPVHTWP